MLSAELLAVSDLADGGAARVPARPLGRGDRRRVRRRRRRGRRGGRRRSRRTSGPARRCCAPSCASSAALARVPEGSGAIGSFDGRRPAAGAGGASRRAWTPRARQPQHGARREARPHERRRRNRRCRRIRRPRVPERVLARMRRTPWRPGHRRPRRGHLRSGGAGGARRGPRRGLRDAPRPRGEDRPARERRPRVHLVLQRGRACGEGSATSGASSRRASSSTRAATTSGGRSRTAWTRAEGRRCCCSAIATAACTSCAIRADSGGEPRLRPGSPAGGTTGQQPARRHWKRAT
jgi:hypothetical protein